MGVLLVAIVAGCSDALEQTTPVGQEIAVLDGQATSLTLVNAGDFRTTALPLLAAVPGASTLAGRQQVVLVPAGGADAVQALRIGGTGSAIPLASGSGATGVAFQDDTLAWVANPGLSTITEVRVSTGDTLRSLAVGPRPVGVAILDSLVFSLNSNTTGNTVQGPSTLTAWNLSGTGAPDTIALSGTDAQYPVVGDDSLLYVIERGDSGAANGRVSVVDPASRQEIVVVNGLGERPGPGVFHPSGRLLIASATAGILELNVTTRSLVRGPGSGIKPGGKGVLALAIDNRGRVYAVTGGACGAGAGTLYVLSPPPDYDVLTTIALGTCPVAAAVAERAPQ